MSAKRGSATLLLTALVTALLLAAVPAPARADTPSPGERIANALHSSPVYVDPAYEGSVPPDRRQELTDQIARTGLPIKVVLTPLTKGDSFNGDSDTLAEIVHDRLALRGLILITTDGDFNDSLNGYEWPGEAHQAEYAVATVGHLAAMEDAGLADRTAKAIELVAEGNGEKAYEEATKDLRDGSYSSNSRADKGTSTQPSWLWPTLIAVLALAAVAFTTFLFVRRRRAPLPYPRTVFTAARTSDEAQLRRQAEAEILSLGESLQSAAPSTPASNVPSTPTPPPAQSSTHPAASLTWPESWPWWLRAKTPWPPPPRPLPSPSASSTPSTAAPPPAPTGASSAAANHSAWPRARPARRRCARDGRRRCSWTWTRWRTTTGLCRTSRCPTAFGRGRVTARCWRGRRTAWRFGWGGGIFRVI